MIIPLDPSYYSQIVGVYDYCKAIVIFLFSLSLNSLYSKSVTRQNFSTLIGNCDSQVVNPSDLILTHATDFLIYVTLGICGENDHFSELCVKSIRYTVVDHSIIVNTAYSQVSIYITHYIDSHGEELGSMKDLLSLSIL